MDTAQRTGIAQRAALVSVCSAVVIVAFKVVAAMMSGSVAVLAEALQSTLDIVLSLGAYWAIRAAARPADENHPYGHGKAEILVSAFQMVVVIVTAAIVAWLAGLRLHDPKPIHPDWGMAAMGYSVVANLAVVFYLRRHARMTGSAALQGEAQHLIGDTLASLGVLGGLVAYVVTGWQPIDPLVAVLFTGLGALFAVRQLRLLIHQLMDGALPPEDIEKRVETLHTDAKSRGFHNVKTRRVGSLRTVLLHVMLDDHLTFVEAHDIAEQIEKDLSAALDGALVTLHYEPHDQEIEHRRKEHGDPLH